MQSVYSRLGSSLVMLSFVFDNHVIRYAANFGGKNVNTIIYWSKLNINYQIGFQGRKVS